MDAVPFAAALLLVLAGCSDPPTPTGGIEGTAMVGPTCPVVQDPPDPECDDRPYEGDLVVLEAGTDRVVERFGTEANGTFRVHLAPGTYDVRSPSGQQLPYCSTQEPVAVEDGRFARVDVSCDSGIR